MRVLHLLASPFFTGPAEAVEQLALAQRALGHQVYVAVDRLRTTHTSEELAVPRLEPTGLLAVDPALELSVKSSPLGMYRDVRALGRAQADVVHCHFSHDHTLARWGAPRGAALVRSIHAPRSLRWSTPHADGWTVPTEALARRVLGAPVLVLPALVGEAFVPTPEVAPLRARLGLPPGPLVGMVSTFQASRRHEVGLAAFALVAQRVPEAQLVLVGDGALRPALEGHVRDLGLAGRVHFVGYQSGAHFVAHLQALDEVWILGLGNDYGARAAAQARACGVRVVAADEGALDRYADALVECQAEALAAAALSGHRRPVTVEAPRLIAERVDELYGRALKAAQA